MPDLAVQDWPGLVSRHITNSSQPLIVIVGPTAGGKTAFALDVAETYAPYVSTTQSTCPVETFRGNVSVSSRQWQGAEIINADSRQFYRGLDIGTAKIREEEKRGVTHHMIDVLDPHEEATIAWYKDAATKIIEGCHGRKVVPLLVGGSMLYVSAVVDGLEPLPKADPALRAKIEASYDVDDGWSLFEKLQEIDPETAHAFDRRNKVYVVRAMELFAMIGIPPSRLKKTVPPPYEVLMLGIRWPRETLARRIEERTKHLLDEGWIAEVEKLLDRGVTPGDPGMKSHGYREIAAWLRTDERDRTALEDVINRKVRAYAKRQETWWDGDERIFWLEGAAFAGDI